MGIKEDEAAVMSGTYKPRPVQSINSTDPNDVINKRWENTNQYPNGFELSRPPIEKPSYAAEFGHGLVRGVASIPQAVYGIAGLAGNTLGLKGLQSWGEESAKSLAKAQEPYKASTQNFTDIDSADSFARYVIGEAGSFLPNLALLGGAGSLGKAFTQKALTGTLEGIGKMSAEQLTSKAAQMGIKNVAENKLKDTIQSRLLETAAKWGHRAGVGGLMGGQALGNIASEQAQSPEGYDMTKALTGAGASAVMGVIPISRALEKTGILPGIEKEVASASIAKNMLKGAAIQGGEMAPMMAGMTAAERFGANKSLTDEEAGKAYINAAAGGTLMGVGIGAFGGAMAKRPVDMVKGKETETEASRAARINKVLSGGGEDKLNDEINSVISNNIRQTIQDKSPSGLTSNPLYVGRLNEPEMGLRDNAFNQAMATESQPTDKKVLIKAEKLRAETQARIDANPKQVTPEQEAADQAWLNEKPRTATEIAQRKQEVSDSILNKSLKKPVVQEDLSPDIQKIPLVEQDTEPHLRKGTEVEAYLQRLKDVETRGGKPVPQEVKDYVEREYPTAFDEVYPTKKSAKELPNPTPKKLEPVSQRAETTPAKIMDSVEKVFGSKEGQKDSTSVVYDVLNKVTEGIGDKPTASKDIPRNESGGLKTALLYNKLGNILSKGVPEDWANRGIKKDNISTYTDTYGNKGYSLFFGDHTMMMTKEGDVYRVKVEATGKAGEVKKPGTIADLVAEGLSSGTEAEGTFSGKFSEALGKVKGETPEGKPTKESKTLNIGVTVSKDALRPDLRGRAKSDTVDTANMMAAGVRTGITRPEAIGEKGDHFTVNGVEYEITGSKQLKDKGDGQIDWADWAKKEGMDPKYVQGKWPDAFKPGMVQTEFKRVNKPETVIEKSTQTTPVPDMSKSSNLELDGQKYTYNSKLSTGSDGLTMETGWTDANGIKVPDKLAAHLDAERKGMITPVKEPNKIVFDGDSIYTRDQRIVFPNNINDAGAKVTIYTVGESKPEDINVHYKIGNGGKKIFYGEAGEALETLADKISERIASKSDLPLSDIRNRVADEMGLSAHDYGLMENTPRVMADVPKDVSDYLDNATKTDPDKLHELYTPEEQAGHIDNLDSFALQKNDEHKYTTDPVKLTLSTGLDNETNTLLRKIGKLFGQDVAFFKATGGGGTQTLGLYFDKKDTIYINTTGKFVADRKSALHTIGHELGHVFEKINPKLYAEIKNHVLIDMKDATGESFKEFDKFLSDKRLSYADADVRKTEFTNDVIGRHFIDSDFWDRMFKTNPDLAEKVGGPVAEMLKKVSTFVSKIMEYAGGRLKYTGDVYSKVFATHSLIEDRIAQIAKGVEDRSSVRKTEVSSMADLDKVIEASDISKLTSELEKIVSPVDRSTLFDKASKIKFDTGAVKNTASEAWDKLRNTTSALFAAWKMPPQETDYKSLFGNYQLSASKSDVAGRGFAKEILKAIPQKARREAIVNYIQAAGDINVLKDREGRSNNNFKQGYTDAQNLTPSEMAFADSAKKFYDAQLAYGIKIGMLKHGVENYVNQLYSYIPKAKTMFDGLKAEFNGGNLKLDPSILQKRIYDTYFDAEQKGLTPKNKDIGFLLNTYNQAFNEAVAARTFIKDLFNNGTAKDGRPMLSFSKAGEIVPRTEAMQSSEFTLTSKMDNKGKEFYNGDYIEMDHAALRGWRHFIIDPTDLPVFTESKLLVHPEIYKTAMGEPDMKSFLSTSKIQESAFGRGLLKVSSELKSTMLSLSMFHQVQEGLHAIFHRVDPTGLIRSLKDVNLDDPHQAEFVKRGLMVSNFDGSALFAEGVQASGLINKIPVLGEYLQKYNQYLFTDYIPRLKMNMAMEAFERNMGRFGPDGNNSLSKTQVYELTAQQSNAAFGELNYKMLGRSKTMQDILRLSLLAPDFLEARARFVGQSLSPLTKLVPGQAGGYGKEQAVAMLVGGLGLYGAGIVANMMVNGKPYYDKPLTLVYNGKEYMLRTVPGDLVHLLSDPRGFVYNRLNPTITRTLVEFLSGRDRFGKKKTGTEQLTEGISGFVPIPLQGALPWINKVLTGMPMSSKDRTLLESAMNSVGIATNKYRTEAEKMIAKNVPIIEDPNENKTVKRLHRAYVEQLRQDGTLLPAIKDAKEKHLIDQHQIVLWTKEAKKPADANLYKHINNLEILQKIYDAGTPEEQKIFKPILNQKRLNLRLRTPS